MERNKFLKNCLITTIIIFIILIGLIKYVPLPEIKLSPYLLIILGTISILIIIFSINLYKIKHEEKINLAKSPVIGKIYEIEKVLDCFYIHKSNLKKGFRIKCQIVDESLIPIGNKVIIHAWLNNEFLEHNHEPKNGYYTAYDDENFPFLGAIFLKPYYGKNK